MRPVPPGPRPPSPGRTGAGAGAKICAYMREDLRPLPVVVEGPREGEAREVGEEDEGVDAEGAGGADVGDRGQEGVPVPEGGGDADAVEAQAVGGRELERPPASGSIVSSVAAQPRQRSGCTLRPPFTLGAGIGSPARRSPGAASRSGSERRGFPGPRRSGSRASPRPRPAARPTGAGSGDGSTTSRRGARPALPPVFVSRRVVSTVTQDRYQLKKSVRRGTRSVPGVEPSFASP